MLLKESFKTVVRYINYEEATVLKHVFYSRKRVKNFFLPVKVKLQIPIFPFG